MIDAEKLKLAIVMAYHHWRRLQDIYELGGDKLLRRLRHIRSQGASEPAPSAYGFWTAF